MTDLISRAKVMDAVEDAADTVFVSFGDEEYVSVDELKRQLLALPSAQSESLTDKEQRIFLAAMGREEKVCKEVDEECRDCREPYEDSLVRTCHEITRKVKGALWT